MSPTPTVSANSKRWALPFFLIWGGQQFSIIGSMLAQFALVWWVTELTGSATVLASASILALVPQVILGPFIGALVDRWPRKRVMIIADGAVAILALGLMLLFVTDRVQVWHIYALMLGRAVGGAFHWPAMAAATPMLVPSEHLTRVNGLNSTIYGLRAIIGPALGALALAALPMWGVMALDVGTALLAILPLFVVRVPDPERSDVIDAVTPRSVWDDVRVAMRYIYGWRGLFWILIVATVANLVSHPTYTLIPLMVQDHFGLGSAAYGTVEVVMGVGMVVGGLVIGVWGGFKRRVWTMILGWALSSVAILVQGWVPGSAFVVFATMVFLNGFGGALTNAPFFGMMQERVPPEMMGRVMTLVMSMAGAAAPIGLALAGPFGDAFGTQTFYRLAGLVCVILVVLCATSPAIRGLEDDPDQAAASF